MFISPNPDHSSAKRALIASGHSKCPMRARSTKLPHNDCTKNSRNMFQTDTYRVEKHSRFAGLGVVADTVDALKPVAQAMCKPGQRGQGIASGYTYLAQFVAHDLAVTRGGTQGGIFRDEPVPNESFMHPLTLSSLYGPEDLALEADPLRLDVPAGHVKLHEFAASALEDEAPVAFDLARDENGVPFVYDGRTDDTPMLSQISALFLAYHNRCAEKLQGHFDPDAIYPICRALTVKMYHQIVRHDLLATLLHNEVHLHYSADEVLIDRGAAQSLLPSVEMTHGVSRFGHPMVRDHYRLNKRAAPVTLLNLLDGAQDLAQIREETPTFWKIDWRLFFGPEAQLSGAIEPSIAPVFADAPGEAIQIDEDCFGEWRDDLAVRDLARSVDSGLASVFALSEHLSPFFPNGHPIGGAVCFDHGHRTQNVENWCAENLGEMSEELQSFFSTDPPLSFFTLLEASWPYEQGGGEGRHLGVLGSILYAESIHAALRNASVEADEGSLARARNEVHGGEEAPWSMEGLINWLDGRSTNSAIV